MFFAPITNYRMNEYIERFRRLNAYDLASAVTLSELGLCKNVIIMRMLREGILAKTSGNKYYLTRR